MMRMHRSLRNLMRLGKRDRIAESLHELCRLKNATVLTSIMNSEVVVPGSIMSGYLDRG